MTRWDSPLFVLSTEVFAPEGAEVPAGSTDPDKETWEEPPYEQIWEAVSQGKISKAPNVVIQVSLSRCREASTELKRHPSHHLSRTVRLPQITLPY